LISCCITLNQLEVLKDHRLMSSNIKENMKTKPSQQHSTFECVLLGLSQMISNHGVKRSSSLLDKQFAARVAANIETHQSSQSSPQWRDEVWRCASLLPSSLEAHM